MFVCPGVATRDNESGQTLEELPVVRGLQFLLTNTCAPKGYSPSYQPQARQTQPHRQCCGVRASLLLQTFHLKSIYKNLVMTTTAWSHVPLSFLSLDCGNLPLEASKLAAFSLVPLDSILQFAAALLSSQLPYLMCLLLVVGKPLKPGWPGIPQLLTHHVLRWPGIPQEPSLSW